MSIPVDYETLRLIWWLLLGVLLIAFAVTDGFDLGVATLLPFVARSDAERSELIHSIEPFWEGNQVWFILGGGVMFAAWPPLYATAFSGFYIAMFLLLVALILRPVGFAFRARFEHPGWRKLWDGALFIGGAVPALLFGAAFGNALQGVPFHLERTLLPVYEGTFFGLLTPFPLLIALISLAMLVMHGAAYLANKIDAPLLQRARNIGAGAALITALLVIAAGFYAAFGIEGYRLAAGFDPAGPSNPLHNEVLRESGALLANYHIHPWMWIAPILAVGGAFATAFLLYDDGNVRDAFIASCASLFGIVATGGLALFPFLLPSSSHPRSSLTIWDSSSSHLTLFIMLLVTLVFLPVIVAYTSWVFRVLRNSRGGNY